jgi:hypothetical protein
MDFAPQLMALEILLHLFARTILDVLAIRPPPSAISDRPFQMHIKRKEPQDST